MHGKREIRRVSKLHGKREAKKVRKHPAVTYTITAAATACAAILVVNAINHATQASTTTLDNQDIVMLSASKIEDPNTDKVEKTVELPVTDEESITIGITRSYLSGNFESIDSTVANPGVVSTDDLSQELSITNISNTIDEQEAARIKQEKEELERIAAQAAQEIAEAEAAKKVAESKARLTGLLEGVDAPAGFLVAVSNTDPNYTGTAINLTADDRWVAEHLVMGEAGNQGFIGAALVAQCIRDAMVNDGYKTVEAVRTSMGYSGKLTFEPNQNVIDAVTYIFDQGQSAVQHRILYFYSSNGGWHETQNFIVQVGAHRFFDRWY